MKTQYVEISYSMSLTVRSIFGYEERLIFVIDFVSFKIYIAHLAMYMHKNDLIQMWIYKALPIFDE